MRKDLYDRLVFLIQTYRTWIEVADTDRYGQRVVEYREHRMRYVCRILVLRVFRYDGQYETGTEWQIPEYEQDKALAVCRRRNAVFRKRLQRNSGGLAADDAEHIIELATRGVVKLKLTDFPIYSD